MTCATFVASCSAVGRLLSPQQVARFGASRASCAWQHHCHPPHGVDSPQAKDVPSIALEKRRKQYFFKLLSAARNRDKRLLASVLKSLNNEPEYVRMQSDTTHADHLRIQDVLLKAASRCGQAALADKFFEAMRARGQFPTQHTAGAFLDALKLDGRVDRCVAVYDEMVDGDVNLGCVCFNIVVSTLVQDGNIAEGMDMLQSASARWGVTPDAYTFNIFFTAAAKQNSAASKAAAKEARALMDRLGVAPDRITVNAQISRAVKEGRLDEAIETFERLLDGGFGGVVPDVISFNVGMAAFMANKMDKKAFELLDEMGRRGICPRADTFNSILTGMTKAGDTLGVIDVFNKYLRQDKAGHDNGVVPSLVSYNLVLQALCLENDKAQARLVIADMRKRNIKPDNITLTALVRLQSSREDVYHVMETARKLRIKPSLAFLNSCIRALGEHNDVYGACQVMDRIKSLDNMKPDAISYNSLIYALVQEPWVFEVIQKKDLTNGRRKSVAVSPIETALVSSDAKPLTTASRRELLPSRGSTNRFEEVIGAEAALLLLEEMKVSAGDSGAVPDIFTYTTVISGMARAEDARRSGRDVKEWWRMPGSQSCSERGDLVDDGPGLVSSTEMCKQLYTEAVDRGIRVNGKLCNAVMVGFGSDLTGAVSFWRQHIRSALRPVSSCTTDEATDDDTPVNIMTVEEKRKSDLFSAYCGLLHVCGRAQRPDAAMKVVYALRKDKITPSATLSNSYFKAKKDGKQLEDKTRSSRAPFRVMQLLHKQMEDTLEGTCGISKHSDPLNLPIERIRIRF